ncbi:hypothetical protein GALMADRAFT_230725 [Galerina marginata CBS 339.88]|uniref:DDE Tnp4 domain-containing protein n=1 Tax=Galerina marginata (strain CBS 339.88) TaxID=685588 RepID=A0A067SGP6_GALM3|nr:hypothetical protein GALMADRAFT_230725 [Galerina marginata CBS 339.88]
MLPSDDAAILQQTLLEEEEDEAEEQLEGLALALGGLILHGAEESRRLRSERRHERRLYLVRPDLLPNPRRSTPWQRMYTRRNNRAFITTMSLDVATFESILDNGFAATWNSTPIPRNDVPTNAEPVLGRRSLDAAGALGLLLHFLSSTMREISLMQIFALIPTTVSRYITFARQILLQTLRLMDDARIQWPTGDEFHENNVLVTNRHPLLTGAFGTMDGLNLPVETSEDQEIENATYNGWLSEHFISNVIVFGATGEIIACLTNAPGSWHDSRVARKIYEKLEHETPEGYYLVTDTAFPRGTDRIHGRIKAPIKSGAALPRDRRERDEFMQFNNQLLSYRQTAEWGNRGLQGSFGRLRMPLPIDNVDARGDLLEICFRLYNLRARKVGLNQIREVYMPIWQVGEQERIWNHFEDMLFSEQRRKDRVAQFHMIVDFN